MTEGGDWHSLDNSEVLHRLDTQAAGLSQAEARRRLEEIGANALPPPKRASAVVRFLRQFHNLLIYVLLAATVATLALQHWVDAGVIAGVVLTMVIIGALQEGRAERALSAIRTLLSHETTVARDGRHHRIGAESLVPGDVVSLSSGDRVPADLRLLRVHELQVDESALTGESDAVAKTVGALAPDTVLADRTNMAFSGTYVIHGRAAGVVVATGARSEIGRIATLAESVHQARTPLLLQMADLSRKLTLMILALATITFGFGFFVRDGALDDSFLSAVALAVAAIPEGLPAVITITLAIGVQRMAARNAIIRRLHAVETIGAATVICSDKTGTLTRNQMMARTVALADRELQAEGSGYDPHGEIRDASGEVTAERTPALRRLLRAGVLCNDAALHAVDDDWSVTGTPTEGALLALAMKAGEAPDDIRADYSRRDAIPFESERRMMATLHGDHAHHAWLTVKGAPETVLALCESEACDGGQRPIERDAWAARVRAMAESGQRTIAIAEREVDAEQSGLTRADLQDGLTLLGVVGIEDPPRPEAIEAVRRCRDAGIRVKMVTGDHATTAQAIAARFAMGDDGAVLTGSELDAMDDAELARVAPGVDVFARTTPEHKLRLVKALQSRDEIVAMTGDGVNDAPALKQAQIGIAMGQRGTEVAREAANMVLTDDNFASIADAVEEGRTVFDNILKTVIFIVPTGLAEALVVLLATLAGMTLPLTPLQILWVNTITAATLGLALAFEPGEDDVMQRRPRPPGRSVFSGLLGWRITFVCAVMLLGTFGQFLWAVHQELAVEQARTIAVNTLVMFEVFYLFNTRYLTRSVLSRTGLTGNRYVLLTAALTVGFQLVFTYAPPLQFLFDTRPLHWHAWPGIVLTAATLLILIEGEKTVLRRYQARAAATAAR